MTNKPTPPSPSELTELAKASISKLLHERKVERVVIVDDVIDYAIELPEILGFLRSMPSDELTKFTARFNDELESIADIDELKDALTEKWRDIAISRQITIRDAAAKIVTADFDQNHKKDLQVLSKIRDCISDIDLSCISPSTWMRDRDALMLPPSENGVVLCLFDQDLSKCKGFTSNGTASGIGLLKEVVSQGHTHVLVGILSHNISVTGSGNEFDFWRGSATNEGLSLSSFLPISKERLAGRFDEFAKQLKFALVNQLSESVKEELMEVYQKAVSDAKEKVRDFDVYNFNHIVMDSSYKEGVSEMETFIRVVDIYAQRKADELSIETGYLGRVQSLLNQVRSINAVDTGVAETLPEESVRNQLRHDELYVASNVLNKSHSPVQCGDIFRIGSDEFILLVQPCDLMVRSSGIRGTNENPRKLIGPLLRMSDKFVTLEDHRRSKVGYAFLQYIEPTNNKGKQVEFDNCYYISIDVLDLAVFNDDGACRIDLSTSIEPPASMHYPWVKRHEKLTLEWNAMKDIIEGAAAEIEALTNETVKKLAWDGLLPCLTIPSLIKTDKVYNAEVFDFGIRRVLRLKEPEASSMLRAYMQYLAREAKDHDFAK